MHRPRDTPATLLRSGPHALTLGGAWTARNVAPVDAQLGTLVVDGKAAVTVDARSITALDTAGAWVLYSLLVRLRTQGGAVTLQGLLANQARLLQVVTQHREDQARVPAKATPQPAPGLLEGLGRKTALLAEQAYAMLSFVGEVAQVFVGSLAHPSRLRWRPILFNIQRAGFDALPIVGLLSFLLGVVVAYQGAAQLRQYGANIFVADLVGLSMLREFAPLITAITLAGRSGSAFAAQIGTMVVTEEVDAMRTLGIAPLELLVLPKIIAMVVVLPLLTVFADVLGVAGGMVMARSQLDVGFDDFLDRMAKAVSMPPRTWWASPKRRCLP
jgi:phospholipid/cholesterol/gamma-HCH transport system permease protein